MQFIESENLKTYELVSIFVIPPDLFLTLVTTVLYALQCYTEPRYNDTLLYQHITPIYMIKKTN